MFKPTPLLLLFSTLVLAESAFGRIRNASTRGQHVPPANKSCINGACRRENASLAISEQPCDEVVGEKSLDYLASKRPYYYNAKLATKSKYIPRGCTPVKFWYFGRHGSRNPGETDMRLLNNVLPMLHKEIMNALHNGRGQLCPESQKELGAWVQPNWNLSEPSFLTTLGERELFEIGSRYKQRFPRIFNSHFNNASYYFKYTDSQRTKASAEAFAKGIFGNEEVKNVWMPGAKKDEPVAKFYAGCSKYLSEVFENETANAEHEKFMESEAMEETVRKVSRRLGLVHSHSQNTTQRNLTVEEVNILYTACRSESSIRKGISPWCHVFDLEDFEVMLYAEDLGYYWLSGHEQKTNYEQACSPFKDAVEYFDRYLKNPNTDKRKVQAYFSHSGATLKMLARLGLFRSDEIRADNFKEQKNSYLWKSSIIDTKASNLAFTLFRCPEKRRRKAKYQIGFFFQEIPTRFPGCDGKAFCSYKTFRKNLEPFIDYCNLSEICQI